MRRLSNKRLYGLPNGGIGIILFGARRTDRFETLPWMASGFPTQPLLELARTWTQAALLERQSYQGPPPRR
jgi:hypothetical protein